MARLGAASRAFVAPARLPMSASLDELEQALGYKFRDRALLLCAVTHSSSVNEGAAGGASRDNERLEFLGDSILGWIVSEWLFEHFRDFSEGQLSLVKNHIVSAEHLVAATHRLSLGQYLHLGRGEESAGGRTRQRLLVNAFEAIIAAVYLDGGASAARDLVARFTIPDAAEIENLARAGPPHDFRAELERLARERNLPKPAYTLTGETGPAHARVFTVQVRVGSDIAFSAKGSSRKKAAHNAAKLVCERLRAA